MVSEYWIAETLYPGWGQRFHVVRELARVQSAFQEIVIFESASHGRVLLLDGAVQITEADEFVYQEMIVHVPLIQHGTARNVLIIGAGDGGVLRRVLQHVGVKRAVMVEIDGDVMRLVREHMPSIAGNAWNDTRAEVITGDGVDYIAQAPDSSFDIVIVDSTDPSGPGESLFTESFYRDCARILKIDGIIVNQCGVPFVQPSELQKTTTLRARAFRWTSAYVAAIPTYVGGFMTLGIAAKSSMDLIGPSEAQRRAIQAGIFSQTQYWSSEIQSAAFALPPYISRLLPPSLAKEGGENVKNIFE